MMNGSIGTIGKFYVSELAKLEPREKTQHLRKTIKNYLRDWPDQAGLEDTEIHLSNFLLRRLVDRYFLDVIKYKHFNGFYDETPCKVLNDFKLAAYMTKWLLKVRPICVLHSGTGEYAKRFGANINEFFAFEYSCLLNNINLSVIENAEFERILHSLRFREFSVTYYSFMLEGLKERSDCRCYRGEDK